MSSSITGIKSFIKKEMVLCISFALAAASMLAVHPDEAYADYIDLRVLAILFMLMVVMAGYRRLGIFDKIAHVMLGRIRSLRGMAFLMVFLCFASAMLITNDVALITFVPFTLLLLSITGEKKQAVILVVLETIAANLGSMLTPVGNPQNLYLYTVSGMGIGDFLLLTVPVVAVSALLLAICCMRMPKNAISLSGEESVPPAAPASCGCATERKNRCLVLYSLIFLLALLTVLRLIPVWFPFAVTLAGVLLFDRRTLPDVDYCLLLTFVCFFVFVGNMGRLEAVRRLLSSLIAGKELWVAFFSSQIISNVPAAILLSGFTQNYGALILGVNIGGLGTLIASLASLISYKAFVQEYPEKKGKYLLYFTLLSVLFAAALLLLAAFF